MRLLLLPLILLLSFSARAEDHEQFQIQTAFIYQFTNYIQWPGSKSDKAGDPFVITLVGATPLAVQLENLARTKSVNGRKIEIRTVELPAQVKRSAIVIISGARLDYLREVSRAVRGTGTLVVTHADGFAAKGAGINFFIEEGRLRFEINRAVLEEQKLEVSSRLLQFARLVN